MAKLWITSAAVVRIFTVAPTGTTTRLSTSSSLGVPRAAASSLVSITESKVKPP